MNIELTRDVAPEIGLRAGTRTHLYEGEPPRDDGQVWVEGEHRYRKNRDGEAVELPRFVLLSPDEYKEI